MDENINDIGWMCTLGGISLTLSDEEISEKLNKAFGTLYTVQDINVYKNMLNICEDETKEALKFINY